MHEYMQTFELLNQTESLTGTKNTLSISLFKFVIASKSEYNKLIFAFVNTYIGNLVASESVMAHYVNF